MAANLPEGFELTGEVVGSDLGQGQAGLPEGFEIVSGRAESGDITPEASAALEELRRRGKIPGQQPGGMRPPIGQDTRSQIMAEMVKEIGSIEAFAIGMGKGFATIGRGIGLVAPEGEIEKAGFEALEEERPIATTAGEIVGEAAPFLLGGPITGAARTTVARAVGAGVTGAVEAGTITKGAGGETAESLEAAGIGAGIGVGAEILFPVIGRIGRKIFSRVTGRTPRGAMLDQAGRPTPELQEALDQAGMTFDDLSQDAAEVIASQRPGAKTEEVGRLARFKEAGVTPTRGEVTKEFPQLTTEQRLLESAGEAVSEPFRQFKLAQSEQVKDTLRGAFGRDVTKEETGQILQDVLVGRRKLLRSQKNDFYSMASEAAKKEGGPGDIPLIVDNISAVVPDEDLLEDLSITAPAAMTSLDKILTKYGLKEPTEEMMEAGFSPTPLTVNNFERFRKTLNAIERGDQTGASSIAISPIKAALDTELDELAANMSRAGISEQIIKPLRAARAAVRDIKTEFSPQSLVGRIIDTKKDGATQITEASKVYDKVIGRASPVEDVRKVISSLRASGEKGKQASSAVQAATIMDLMDAGFGTESRQISGIKIFNPIAFKRRLDNIGRDKVKAIFKGNDAGFKKIQNIEKIVSDLVPPAGATPKGSAMVNLEIFKRLGGNSLLASVPGGAFVIGSIEGITRPVKVGREVSRAIKAQPQIEDVRTFIERTFSGMASAMGIAVTTELQQQEGGGENE